MDRTTGTLSPLKLPPGTYQHVRISPDGKQVAFSVEDAKEVHVSVYELSGRVAARRLTFAGNNRFPIWTSNGQRIAFQSDREKDLAIFWQRADTSGVAERLTRPDSGTSHVPESWSPDGEHLLFASTTSGTTTLWTLSLKDRHVERVEGVESPNPIGSVFSPDGRWIAYSTSERLGPGSDMVYVQPFPPTGAKYQVPAPGHHPMWPPDGKELFFEPGQNQLAVIPIQTSPVFSFGNAVALSGGTVGGASPAVSRNRDITPDAKRFIAPILIGESETITRPTIHFVQNWFEELKRLAPTN